MCETKQIRNAVCECLLDGEWRICVYVLDHECCMYQEANAQRDEDALMQWMIMSVVCIRRRSTRRMRRR